MEQGKPDLNTALPVRQTASIFKQPVTKITNHPSNKVKSDPQKAVDQPRQVRLRNSWISYWENPKIICFNFVNSHFRIQKNLMFQKQWLAVLPALKIRTNAIPNLWLWTLHTGIYKLQPLVGSQFCCS